MTLLGTARGEHQISLSDYFTVLMGRDLSRDGRKMSMGRGDRTVLKRASNSGWEGGTPQVTKEKPRATKDCVWKALAEGGPW